jgi:molybdopterin synthase catalytic subunit
MPALLTAIHDGPVPILPLDVPGSCGAECVFAGRTRGQTHPDHGRLLRLEYEMYEPMAARLLRAMAEDAAAKWDCGVVRAVHARGPVPLGEASVVIQVATPHRAASFEACRYLIERLKHELPVWKHEVWENGRTFVEGWIVKT